jgi:hypothetical protein
MSIFKTLANLSDDFKPLANSSTAEYQPIKVKYIEENDLQALQEAVKAGDDDKFNKLLGNAKRDKSVFAAIARKDKPKKGTRAYHMDKAADLSEKMHKEAVKATGFKGDNDRTKGHEKRLIAYMDHNSNSPHKVEFRKHWKLALKAEAVASDAPPTPTNTKLWESIKKRAKAKFDVYPSWVSSQWCVKQYKKAGGKYSAS